MSALAAILFEYWEIIAGGVALVAVFFAGGQRQKSKQIKRKAKADANTHTRINEVTPVDPVDRHAVTKRLRDLSE